MGKASVLYGSLEPHCEQLKVVRFTMRYTQRENALYCSNQKLLFSISVMMSGNVLIDVGTVLAEIVLIVPLHTIRKLLAMRFKCCTTTT